MSASAVLNGQHSGGGESRQSDEDADGPHGRVVQFSQLLRGRKQQEKREKSEKRNVEAPRGVSRRAGPVRSWAAANSVPWDRRRVYSTTYHFPLVFLRLTALHLPNSRFFRGLQARRVSGKVKQQQMSLQQLQDARPYNHISLNLFLF